MSAFTPLRLYALRPGAVECDSTGPRVGGAELLSKDTRGQWADCDLDSIEAKLAKAYEMGIDASPKLSGLNAVVRALNAGDIALAQIAALLLKFPDPDLLVGDKVRLEQDLVACGLLRAVPEWEAAHPRTGQPPNAGWFAVKPGEDDGAASSLDARSPLFPTPPPESNRATTDTAMIGTLTHQIHQPGGWTACIYSNNILLMFDGHVKCPDAAIGKPGSYEASRRIVFLKGK